MEKVGKMDAAKKLAVVYRKGAALVPSARNARTHSDAQIAQIAASMQEFGFTNPVLIDAEGGIIAGHGRVLAAEQLGLESIPTIALPHLSEAQRRAYAIADNQLALNAGWDAELLRMELVDLKDLGTDLDLLGFSPFELSRAMTVAGEAPAEADQVPDLESVVVSVTGDVWLLGEHRLACGDCTDAGTVEKALGGFEPRLMVTDPPYGVNYDPAWRSAEFFTRTRGFSQTSTTFASEGSVMNDSCADWSGAWALFSGDVAYVWHSGTLAAVVQASLVAAGLEIRSQIIWHKSHFAMGRADYHWQHEACWYAVRKGKQGHWSGDRKQSTVWTIDAPIGAKSKKDGPNARTGHATQKPVECMRRPIMNNSLRGEAVYEPFSGSGTTIIAAEFMQRRCCAIEIYPAYVDVAVRRWQTFSGKTATLEDGGRSFEEVSASRREKSEGSSTQSATNRPRKRKAEPAQP